MSQPNMPTPSLSDRRQSGSFALLITGRRSDRQVNASSEGKNAEFVADAIRILTKDRNARMR
jgi:hypothetical protein